MCTLAGAGRCQEPDLSKLGERREWDWGGGVLRVLEGGGGCCLSKGRGTGG